MIQGISPHFSRVDFDVLSIGSNSLPLLVSFEWLAHVEGIATVVVIVRYSSENRIPGFQISKSIVA